MQSTAKLIIDRTIFEKLYMSGKTDDAIARVINCSNVRIHKERVNLKWPSNQGLFSWQRKLRRSEFESIPAKYRYEN